MEVKSIEYHADVRLENHGSFFLFRPLTEKAKTWLRRTAPADAQFVDDALAVEPRFVLGVVNALGAAGFICE